MNLMEGVAIASQRGDRIARGTVVATHGTITVSLPGVDRLVTCDVLHSSQEPLLLAEEDAVLVWLPAAPAERGVIIGRVGPSRAPAEHVDDVPDELVFEAKRSLTLRVGDGSITMREDGKILIKGKDLVSHARRMNRIKGGAVSIN